jgi:hypothetical protein
VEAGKLLTIREKEAKEMANKKKAKILKCNNIYLDLSVSNGRITDKRRRKFVLNVQITDIRGFTEIKKQFGPELHIQLNHMMDEIDARMKHK